MKSLSIFSGLLLLTVFATCLPYQHLNERNLESTDLEPIADLLNQGVEVDSPAATDPKGTQHQTQSPERTTAPRQSQSQPRETQSAPRQTYTQPRETQSAPRQTFTQPRETQSQPRETQSAPRQTYTQPRESQTQPRETQTAPRETFTQPRETHTAPQQTYTQPRETQTAPRETFTQPRETHTAPQQTYTQPRQTFTPPVQTYTQPRETHTEPHETHTPPVQSDPGDTRTNPRHTSTQWTQSYTEPRQTYTPPFRTTTYNPPHPTTTYISVYDPYSNHRTHHRSENSYTTIYISVGNPTTYVQPIYVTPTFYWPPPTITLAPQPVTYTTVYVYPGSDSDTQTFYSTITTYVTQGQQTSTVYQTYVPPPASTAQAGPGAEPTAGVNPWAASCPLPSDFVINNFVSDSGGVSLSISYNGGTFNCPNTATNEVVYNGMNDMYCDDDGLVRVITDGSSWLWVSEWSWCNSVPATAGNMPTLEASTNYTNFGYYALDCTSDPAGHQSCKQAVQDFAIPVVSYGLGGAIGFAPLDINGNYLPGCPSVTNVQPIVTNTATCSGAQVQSTGLTTVTIIT